MHGKKNIFSYMKDIFCREKVLSTQKISSLWFTAKNFDLEKVLKEEY